MAISSSFGSSQLHNPPMSLWAIIDGEATIKRLGKGPGYWVLKPESKNHVHEPILLNRDFSSAGIVFRVFKKGSELLGLLEQ